MTQTVGEVVSYIRHRKIDVCFLSRERQTAVCRSPFQGGI